MGVMMRNPETVAAYVPLGTGGLEAQKLTQPETSVACVNDGHKYSETGYIRAKMMP